MTAPAAAGYRSPVRFREELARSERASGGERASAQERDRVADAVGAALATSGRTILFSGAIVALALASLLVVDSPIFREVDRLRSRPDDGHAVAL